MLRHLPAKQGYYDGIVIAAIPPYGWEANTR